MLPKPFFSRLTYGISVLALCAAPVGVGARMVLGHSRPASLTQPDANGVRPQFLLFSLKGSSVEREFVASLPSHRTKVVSLSSLEAAEAREYGVTETPTLIRLSAKGKEEERSIGASPIATQFRKLEARTASCSSQNVKRLQWVEETDRRAPWIYRRFQASGGVPDIFKTMSLRPELMDKVFDLSERAHFSDGYLDYRTKERIATLVSALNRSRYCTSSHAAGLNDLGVLPAQTTALAAGDVDAPGLDNRQRAMLSFARRLTKDPGANIQEEVERLRKAGWRDEQIFEAAFDVSLFNFFNRMAAAYQLETPPDGWKPLVVATAPTR